MEHSETPSTNASRDREIDQLIIYIRFSDIHNARRMLVNLLSRGKPISQEILLEYQKLESRLS